ncbi:MULTISPECIES: hypothetical protein [Vitreoscilla]|uniref:DUF3592 domain-containing protein n=1 Tax=Vitreoscilla stercoraria TaxID=61 RepID=A0ABY4E9H8_VITST|nr:MULTISPECIES: hypothetical protein [Vitreoscilla]AUZ06233.2 hypothetical protein ADP71_30350 [Vitreoscilla sp. C1]UOO92408.1 hypothetical protein LVJ81_12520 [Vitreoscilla stercoraria]
MLVVLIIAVLLLFGCVLLVLIVPHPITWLMALVLGLLIGLILLPKYQAQKQALEKGVTVMAQVQSIRQWQRKEGDGNYKTQYEVTAHWLHPNSGKLHVFVSNPLVKKPVVAVGDEVAVLVVWERSEYYQMDEAYLQ